MSSFLGKIKEFFKKTKNKKVYFVVGFFVFIGLFLLVQPTSAQEFLGIDFRAGLVGAVTDILLGISSWFIKVTVWISQIFIIIASYNNFINSKAVILGWVLVRDIVNMFFVIILLAIAFGTVLGLEQYEWKKLLVKLVFAAVLINFSRVICGVIIDAAQVFMMTFVNGFSATAGGNVINGLNLNKIYNLSSNADPQTYTNNVDLLVTGVAAVFFGAISMFVLGAYLAVILFRVVSLWVLIILSPIAFMSSVLLATEKYASEWWKEFNNNVLAGPLLAFFFLLSFAIVGDGSSVQEGLPKEAEKKYESEALLSSTATGAAAAMDWGAMASFAVAIALLITGVKKTQELGVQGAGMLSSALSTTKKVAMTASGVAAVGWGLKKTAEVGKAAGKGVLMGTPFIGGQALKNYYLRGEIAGKRYLATNLREGGALGKAYGYLTQGKKVEALRKAQSEGLGEIIEERTGSKASFQEKLKNEAVKKELELAKRAKEARKPGYEEGALARVEAVAPGLLEEVQQAEIRAGQTADLVKTREGLSKEQISRGLLTRDTEFVDRQRELESLKQQMKRYQDNTSAIKETIASREEREVSEDLGFIDLQQETLRESLISKEIKGEVSDREQLRELETIADLLRDQTSEYRRELEDRRELGFEKIEQERAVRTAKATAEVEYFEDLNRGNRPDRARRIMREEEEHQFNDIMNDNYKERNQAELTAAANTQAEIIHNTNSTNEQRRDARRHLNAIMVEAGKDPASLQAVRNTVLARSNYRGLQTSDNSTEMMASIFGALDNNGNVDFNEFQDIENQIGEVGLKNLRSASYSAALKSGDASLAAGIGVGSDGAGNLIYGFGSNVGSHDERGNARPQGAGRITNVTDSLDWISERVSGANAPDSSHLFKRDQNNRTIFDNVNLRGLANSMRGANVTNWARNTNPAVIRGIVQNLTSLSTLELRNFFTPFAQQMSNQAAFVAMARTLMQGRPANRQISQNGLINFYRRFHP